MARDAWGVKIRQGGQRARKHSMTKGFGLVLGIKMQTVDLQAALLFATPAAPASGPDSPAVVHAWLQFADREHRRPPSYVGVHTF